MEDKVVQILERQRQDLVVRMLRKHEEMESTRFFTERILSGISEFFLLLDKDFQVIQTNREFLARTGYPPPGKKPLTLQQLFPEDKTEAIKVVLRQKEFAEVEAHLLTHNGRSLPVKMRGSTHVTQNGRVLHMLICSDCSEFFELMTQMQEAQKQLLHSCRLASLGEMAAGIGHELTQPLNAILLFARNCLKALDTPGNHEEMLKKNLQIIVDRVNKASSIIATMRSFGRKVEEDRAPVDLNEIIRKILKFLEAQFNLSEIELDVRLAPTPCEVLGVEVRLEQVFLNLVQNAIQAMGRVDKPRLVIISRLTHCINLTSLRKEPYVQVMVADNGEGISEEMQKKIFDPFFTTREVGTGMGLGLSIVDRIVRGFAGYIDVESAPGKGACFSVYIPHLEHKMGATQGDAS